MHCVVGTVFQLTLIACTQKFAFDINRLALMMVNGMWSITILIKITPIARHHKLLLLCSPNAS